MTTAAVTSAAATPAAIPAAPGRLLRPIPAWFDSRRDKCCRDFRWRFSFSKETKLVFWLIGLLAAWLVGWLVGCLAGRLDGWLVVWLVGWLAGSLAGWLVPAVSSRERKINDF